MLVLFKILIRHSVCDETKRINRNSSLFGNFRMFWPRFIDLQNFILLIRTVPFFRKIICISSYTEKIFFFFFLYELIQDLPYSKFSFGEVCRRRYVRKISLRATRICLAIMLPFSIDLNYYSFISASVYSFLEHCSKVMLDYVAVCVMR